MRTAEQAPKPPPKSRRDLGRLLGRSGRSGESRKSKHRTSQYVEPVVHGAEDEALPVNHIDVIDQLDISGVHGASCTSCCALTQCSTTTRRTMRARRT